MEISEVFKYGDELFNQYYDPGTDPLTEEEWWEILVKYDYLFNYNDPIYKNKVVDGTFDQFLTPCKEHFTNEEWSDIIKRFDTTGISDNEELSIEKLEVRYGGHNKEDNNAIDKNHKKGRKRKRILHRSKKHDKYKSSDQVDLKIIQTNCDGFTSKKISFEDIVKERSPDVVLVQETALKEKRKFKLRDYFSLCKNREKEKGEKGRNVEEWARKLKIENVGQMSDMMFDNRQVTYRSNVLSVRWGVIEKS